MTLENNTHTNQRWSPIFQMESVDLFAASLLDPFDKNAYMLNPRFSICSYDSQQEDTSSSIQDQENPESMSPHESIHNDKVKEQDDETNTNTTTTTTNATTAAATATVLTQGTLSSSVPQLLHPQKKRGLLHKSSTFFNEKVMGHKPAKIEIESESNLDTRKTSCPGPVTQETIVTDPVEPKKRAHWLKRLFWRD